MKLRRTSGFTLIEMLTVIAIISILAGMIFVVVSKAKKRAHIAKANAEVRELTRAWNAYWIAFEEWPSGFEGVTNAQMTAGRVAYLMGQNGRNLQFLDAGPKVKAEGFKDPWGAYYRVDFSKTRIESNDVFEACVAFPSQKRYNYDN